MKNLLAKAPRFLFFTGKGGVGKTSMDCTTAVGLAETGKRILLISTDPASNLDEVLETKLGSTPTEVNGVSGLYAMNINPIDAAGEYRERMVGPYRGVLPDATIQQMEEQLSGACTVEIAGFSEFSKFIGNDEEIKDYDHVVLDTAPTGHTLRLLNLPSAWNDFIASNKTGSSCLGPVSGLAEQKILFENVVNALKNPDKTLLVLVSRAEEMSFYEAARTSLELSELGLSNQHLITNGVFVKDSDDNIAKAFADKSKAALERMPEELKTLPTTIVPFRPSGVMGIEALQSVCSNSADLSYSTGAEDLKAKTAEAIKDIEPWSKFLKELEAEGSGVIMTMGKGGVGKTTMAAMIATQLAQKGHSVLLSTTDPAAHVTETIGENIPNLHVEKIDPKVETQNYVCDVINKNRGKLSLEDMALLEEELRSPCIEEIAVFQAFAQTVAKGQDKFIVLDTAPTGHTLLLLDSTEAYHKQVAKTADDLPDEVKGLLPRIRDPKFTKVLIVALPEATPTHEAEALQSDLRRAGIEPYGWIINRSFAVSGTTDSILCAKGLHELDYIGEITEILSNRTVISPWIAEDLVGAEKLETLMFDTISEIKRASESPKATESGLRAEAEGRALPDRNAVTREQPSSEPKKNL
ncbi:MAG: arsenical pump-driving ATPase [Candidatus Melainabacteria bacterium GWF2_32_7]|nr:MAG: arsenical pump-driving ATPase [Candidatus Melainabacteria bacterium GWF2_32_7]